MKSTSSETRRRRHKLLFALALTTLCLALTACLVLLTLVLVRRRLQHPVEVVSDVTYDTGGYDAASSRDDVPSCHNGTTSPGASTVVSYRTVTTVYRL